MNLFNASRQWAERPADERFASLETLHKATKEYYNTAVEATVPYSQLRTENMDGDVVLVGKKNAPAKFTHWSFGQLANRVGAPAEYLRNLPATLAVQNLNHGLKVRSENESLGDAQLMFHKNGGMLLRSLTSERYSRFWNYEIAERLIGSKRYGWKVPPARPAFANQPGTRHATKEDVLNDPDFNLSVKVGDLIAPAGIYASDHDMFVILVNPNVRISDGSDQGLSRFVMIENSEVGDASINITRGLYAHVCGNHIIWDARNVTKLSIRHIGNVWGRVEQKFMGEIIKYANTSASDQEAQIKRARAFKLGMNKDEVLDHLFGKRFPGGTRKLLETGYEAAVEHSDVYGDPNTVWGMVNGITEVAQNTPYGDHRVNAERVAGKIMQIAF